MKQILQIMILFRKRHFERIDLVTVTATGSPGCYKQAIEKVETNKYKEQLAVPTCLTGQ